MDQITTHVFQGNDIRTMTKKQELWMVAKDVTDALGYANGRDAVNTKVHKEDKAGVVIHDGRQRRTMTIINESGMYALIFGSELKKAEEFKRWVTSEVLPSIRKHGMYATPATVETMLGDPDTMIQMLTAYRDEQQRRQEVEAALIEAAPKVQFAEAVHESVDDISIAEMAGILKQNGYDTGQNRLCEQLRMEGYLVQRPEARRNLPTQRSMDLKIMRIKETAKDDHLGIPRTYRSTRITGKGQIYFVKKYCGRLLPVT